MKKVDLNHFPKGANEMRALVIAAVALLFLGFTPVQADWATPPPQKTQVKECGKDSVMTTRWEGETDLELLKKVRQDIDIASSTTGKKICVLKVDLLSPGGPVVTSVEIARQVRLASNRGLVMELHGYGVIASGGTLVMASGTPGHRYIANDTIVLVHPIQTSSFFGPSTCASYVPEPKTEDEKIVNTLLVIMKRQYVRFTGKTEAEVEKWLTCGNEQAGDGSLAVKLGLADKTED